MLRRSSLPRTFSCLFACLTLSACGRADASADAASSTLATSRGVSRPEFTPSAALLSPTAAALAITAPDSFNLVLETSKGEIEVAVRREWAPRGVDRLYFLATNGFFTGMPLYRVQRDLMAQFGLTVSAVVNAAFDTLRLVDDTLRISNSRGTLAFASMGPNTRTTELYFNLRDNPRFDGDGLVPLGRTVRGAEVLPLLFSQHGQGLSREKIVTDGGSYLSGFPLLDFIVRVTVKP